MHAIEPKSASISFIVASNQTSLITGFTTGLNYLIVALSFATLAQFQPQLILFPLVTSSRFLFLFISAFRRPLTDAQKILQRLKLNNPFSSPISLLRSAFETGSTFWKTIRQDNQYLICLYIMCGYALINPIYAFLSELGVVGANTLLGDINSFTEVMLFCSMTTTVLYQRLSEYWQAPTAQPKCLTKGSHEPFFALCTTILMMIWLIHDEFAPLCPRPVKDVLNIFSLPSIRAALCGTYIWNTLHWTYETFIKPNVISFKIHLPNHKPTHQPSQVKPIPSDTLNPKPSQYTSDELSLDLKNVNHSDLILLEEVIHSELKSRS
ncbi:MAG: hypothetical protein VXY77_02470 [Pseudomonadota bacterium]|nr:hypothetical protein [Pseudomonadota bacterium]